MKTPHHATASLARKLGVALTIEGDAFVATKGDLRAVAPDAKAAVAAIVAQLPKVKAEKKAKKPRAKVVSKKGKGGKPEKSGMMGYKYYERYRKNGGNCGDDLAVMLTSAVTFIDKGKSGKANRKVLDIATLHKVAKENGIDISGYSKLNNGAQRMDVSNKLRGRVRDGEKVTILGKVFRGVVAGMDDEE